jgi:hypothetical protein
MIYGGEVYAVGGCGQLLCFAPGLPLLLRVRLGCPQRGACMAKLALSGVAAFKLPLHIPSR